MRYRNYEGSPHHNQVKSRQSRRNGEQPSSPIHVSLMRHPDKHYILRNSATKLKDNPYEGAKIFIFDVSKAVRNERKTLKKRHLEGIRSREDVEHAFSPWSIIIIIIKAIYNYNENLPRILCN